MYLLTRIWLYASMLALCVALLRYALTGRRSILERTDRGLRIGAVCAAVLLLSWTIWRFRHGWPG